MMAELLRTTSEVHRGSRRQSLSVKDGTDAIFYKANESSVNVWELNPVDQIDMQEKYHWSNCNRQREKYLLKTDHTRPLFALFLSTYSSMELKVK